MKKEIETTPDEVIDMGGIIYLADGTEIRRKPNQSLKEAMGEHKDKDIKAYQHSEQMSAERYEKLKAEGILP